MPATVVAAPVAAMAPPSAPLAGAPSGAWDEELRQWADAALQSGKDDLLGEATPLFERVMIEAALTATRGQRQEAARRLGWGRNTLSRKIKELGMGEDE